MIYFFSAPIGFLKRVHHKRISQQIHVSFSRELICLLLNFSCGLLLIGPLIYSHPTLQKVRIFRQTDGFPRHVFITATYTNLALSLSLNLHYKFMFSGWFMDWCSALPVSD